MFTAGVSLYAVYAYAYVCNYAYLDIVSKIRLCQSIRIYLKNNRAKFHPDQI